jgi:recombination protein RecA
MSKKMITMGEAEKELIKLLGEDTVFLDGDLSIGKYEVISTGSESLDYCIGIGGIPRGRITQLAGKESSGKTMLALSCIKSYLDDNPDNTALFIDAEFTYDPDWARSLGVDTSRVMVLKTNDAKKIFQGLLGVTSVNSNTKKVTKKIKGILDLVVEGEVPRFKNLGIIVLDSIAVLNTPIEHSAEIGKANMAPIPRFLSTELKKLTPVVAEANVAFIGINQVRVNLGQMYGDPTSSPGGKALKHACSLMVNMAPISGADSVISNESGDRIGHKVRAKIGKNKVGRPFMVSEYYIEYVRGVVNQEAELLDLATKMSIIHRPSSKSYLINGEKIVGKASAISAISAPGVFNEIRGKVRRAYLDGEVACSDAADAIDIEISSVINDIE